MKNYSLFFEDDRFDSEVVPVSKLFKPYELYEDGNSLFMLLPAPKDTNEQLKIYYPKELYIPQVNKLHRKIILQLLLLSIVALLISTLFAFYTLDPLRRSLRLLETFIKDIIHDLNTPVSNILLNLKMMDSQTEEVQSIEKSAKTIYMLHSNLNAYLYDIKNKDQKFYLRDVLDSQIDFFASMFQYLDWNVDVDNLVLFCDKDSFSRVVYNLINNACKHNTPDGYVSIWESGQILYISNSSFGVKNPSKVFDRFYKEGERGLGIGLHIVENLCKELNIKKRLTVKDNIFTITLDLSKVTSS